MGLVSGFFYVLDLFPHRFDSDEDVFENTDLWRVLLGIIYWGEGESEGKHLVDMNAHFDFLDKEIDSVTQKNLESTGVYINDIYGLFVHIIETYATRVTHSITQLSSMYGKKLTTIDYVLQDVQQAINRFKFAIQPNKKKVLTRREVETQIWQYLKPTIVTQITNGRHGEVNSIAIPGDNKFFKGTSTVILQSESGTPKGATTISDGDPSKYLHVSIAENGSISTMSKSEPTGRSRGNPYAYTENDTFERNPIHIDLLDRTQKLIER